MTISTQVLAEWLAKGERRSKLVRGEKTDNLSQHDYRPTAFQSTEWEKVGPPLDAAEFFSMSLEVMQEEYASADPMFATFGAGPEVFRDGTVWEAPGGNPRKTEEEDEGPKIDWTVVEAQLQEKYEQGLQEGLAQAEVIAQAKIVENTEALAQRMVKITEELKKHTAARLEKLEKQALKFSLDIARKIVETTVELKPEYILDIIRHALKSLGAAKPIRLRVSTQDFEFLEVVGLPADLTPHELGVQYVADDSIKSGCVVETDFGEVNLELDKMWERVRDNLYQVCR